MIITRTPFRISFFGGGTDYPAYYRENGGAVLSTTINKYCYISCRKLPPFFDHKSRIVWSLIEMIKNIDEIQHPAVREVLKFLKVDHGVSIHHEGDLPARSGLGSSSSFTVGLLSALMALQGKMTAKLELAKIAVHLEQNVMKENVGSQDQVAAAVGGFNKIEFNGENDFAITPVCLAPGRLHDLQRRLMLYFTGTSRTASEIAGEQIKSIPKKTSELKKMREMVDHALNILNSGMDLREFGKLLHESWLYKKTLSDRISNSYIDSIYEKALKTGALGGKILGAGGGGFILFFVEPEDQNIVRDAMSGLLEVPMQFENQGSQIVYYNP